MDALSYPATSAPSRPEEAPSDEQLLAGLVGGEPGAEAAFVRRFQSRVYGLATAIVGDGPQGNEVAEQAMVRACLHARSYESRSGPVITWVLGITRQLAVETRRRHPAGPVDGKAMKRSERTEIYLGQFDSGPGSGPEAAASVSERTTAMRCALSRLPVEQRRAVVLAAVYGHSAREISEAEAIPLDRAQAHVRSGLAMMHTLLRQLGP